MSSQSVIEKDPDERYQIDNVDQIEKKMAENDEEALIGDK